MARWSYSFVCLLHYPITIIKQMYVKVFDYQPAWQARSVYCVSANNSIVSVNL